VDYTKFRACCGFRVPLDKHPYAFRMREQIDTPPRGTFAAARSIVRYLLTSGR
jgi:hypothetical protein